MEHIHFGGLSQFGTAVYQGYKLCFLSRQSKELCEVLKTDDKRSLQVFQSKKQSRLYNALRLEQGHLQRDTFKVCEDRTAEKTSEKVVRFVFNSVRWWLCSIYY